MGLDNHIESIMKGLLNPTQIKKSKSLSTLIDYLLEE